VPVLRKKVSFKTKPNGLGAAVYEPGRPADTVLGIEASPIEPGIPTAPTIFQPKNSLISTRAHSGSSASTRSRKRPMISRCVGYTPAERVRLPSYPLRPARKPGG